MGHPETLIPSPSSETAHLQIFESGKDKNSIEQRKIQDTLDLHSNNLTSFPTLETRVHITHINLDYNHITQLPVGLSRQFPQLQSFTANGNEISLLPDEFGELSNLQELFLCENKLALLPECFCKLQNLKILKLNANLLKRLHSEIGQNIHLEVLSLDENKLKRFPATLGLLNSLRVLEASCNRLEVLPSTLNFLENLTSVDLSNNRLTEIPESFGLLENLTHIDLSENKLGHLCNNFQSTKTLQRLFLDLNIFGRCPDWFRELESIIEIRMKCNELSGLALPDGFGLKSRHLKILDLRGNFIEKLPTSFGHLQCLELLLLGTPNSYLERSPNFQNGNWLSSLPQNFSELTDLRELHLAENQLEILPEDIGQLLHLEAIFLGSNMLVELPVSFTKLVALKKCQLSKNRLKKLPENIGELESLTELYLDMNQLKTLPPSMKKLTNLEVLDLSENRLKEAPSNIIAALTRLKSLSLYDNRFDLTVSSIPTIAKKVHQAEQKTVYCTNKWQGRHNKKSQEINESHEEAGAGINKIHSDGNENLNQDIDDSDSEEDWDEETENSASSSSSSEREKPHEKLEEEDWSSVTEQDNTSFKNGQFDLDDDDDDTSPRQVFLPAPVRFDSCGNSFSFIHADILSHRSTPYIYHASKVNVPYDPGYEIAGQFDSDSSDDVYTDENCHSITLEEAKS